MISLSRSIGKGCRSHPRDDAFFDRRVRFIKINLL